MRRRCIGAMVIGAGVLAAACSTSPSKPATTTTSQPTTTTTSTASTTTSTSTPTTTGIAACAQVSATVGQTQGAAGTIVGTITLAEVGTGTCTVNGYATLTRFNASGATVPTTMVNGLTVNLSGPASEPPTTVTLTPTQGAAFTFQYSDVITGSETSCANSTTLSVTTPGATSPSAPVALMMQPCNSGTVRVSPVYAAGTS